jgi:two-component system cell cycle response regulator DivK
MGSGPSTVSPAVWVYPLKPDAPGRFEEMTSLARRLSAWLRAPLLSRPLLETIVLTVLLIEDHPMNRKLVRDILEIQFAVMEAETAEAGLEILKTRRPDLILLDMQLPGMDGLTLARHLKEDPERATIPIIGLSAHAMTRDVELAMEAGCADYITKPITDDPFSFLERISKALPSVSAI